MEQTVLLLVQVSNLITFYRRFYMLLALTNSPRQSKQMLREYSELLHKNDKNLFGIKIRESIRQTSKSKKQTLEMLSNKMQTLSPQSSSDTEEKFRRATTTKLLIRKEAKLQYSKTQYNNNVIQNIYGYGYATYNPGNLVQQNRIFLCSSTGRSKTHISVFT